MDALEEYLTGGEAKATPPTKPELKLVPDARPVFNPGNLRPSGSATGFQQFKTPEEGISAVDKNLQSYGKKGINTLRGVISTWAPPSENDTNAYIKNASQRIGIDPDAPIDLSDPVQRHLVSAAIISHEQGPRNIFAKRQTATQAQQTSETLDPLEEYLTGKIAKPKELAAQAQVIEEPAPQGAAFGVGNAYTRKLAAQPRENRATGAPLSVAENVGSMIGNLGVQTLGSLKGVLGSIPEAIRTGQAPGPIGERIRKEFVEKHQFAPTSELGQTMGEQIGGVIEPMKIPPFVPGMMELAGVQAGKQVVETAKPKPLPAKISYADFQKMQQEKAQAAKPPVPAIVAAEIPTEASEMVGVGAARVGQSPYPAFTGQETGKGELFPVVKTSKIAGDVPKTEQSLKADILSEVTGTNQLRTGVLTGNENTLRNEYTEAARPDASLRGQMLKKQIVDEQNALSKYSQDRIKETGASPSLVNEEQRGERINNVLYGKQHIDEPPTTLEGYLDQAKKQVYDSAFATHGNTPAPSAKFNELMADKQWNAGLSTEGTKGIATTAKEWMQLADEVGFKDKGGKILPAGSVAAKDAVRKALNQRWNRDNALTIMEINQAIDKDIAAVADPKLYKLGDRIHQVEKTIYDTKGIKRLFGVVNEKGIVESPTALDKVTKTLNNLPTDEWRHIRGTLKDLSNGIVRGAPEGMPSVPKSLRESARAAVAEIDGALAREVFEAGANKIGVWNQNSVTNVLNSRVGHKIAETFSPDEVAKFHKLNLAGHWMPGVHQYEGAALQGERLGVIKRNYPTIGRELGAATHIPFAATIGEKVGEKLQTKALRKQEIQQAQKLQEEMRRNVPIKKMLP